MAKKSLKVKQVKVVSKFNPKTMLMFAVLFALVGLVSLVVSYANPGNKGGGRPPKGSMYTLSYKVTTDKNNDGLPNFTEGLTFDVSPIPTMNTWGELQCFKNSVLVSSETNGFFTSYPWDQTYTLGPTSVWTEGGADCSGTLFYTSNSKRVVLASTSFHVNP
jgi:hypothetical protein